MNCLTKEDIIFYILNKFQDDVSNISTKKHIDKCPECYENFKKLEKEIHQMIKQNEEECDLILDSLIDYGEGKITSVHNIDIHEHLNDCHFCRYIYYQISKELTLEEAKNLDIKIPERLAKSIKEILTQNSLHHITEQGEKLKNKLYDLMDKIILTIIPLPKEAPAFMGDQIYGYSEVEFLENDVVVDVGESNKVVKIFSQENEELDCQISDKDGIVVFSDFLPDKYKIMVEGYKIKEVKYIR